MTDQRITDLTPLIGANADGDDRIEIVDRSDTTMAASGTNKQISRGEFFKNIPSAVAGDVRDSISVYSQTQVDNLVNATAANVGKRARVRAATTANITIATDLNNSDVVDGVTLATGDLVLVKDQSTAAQNGVYVVGTSPARFVEFDTYDDHPGSLIAAQEGTTNGDTLWLCTSNTGGTLGTTAIAFTKMVVAGELLAANNLSDLASASLARTNLSLGTIATQNANAVTVTGGSLAGMTSVDASAYTGPVLSLDNAFNTITATGTNAMFGAARFGSAAANLPVFALRRALGTAGTPTNITNGVPLGAYAFLGYNSDASYYQGALIQGVAGEAWSTAGYRGTRLEFLTSPIASGTAATLRATIDQNGDFYIGNSQSIYNVPYLFQVGSSVTTAPAAQLNIHAYAAQTAFACRRFNGTISARTAVLNGNVIFAFTAGGYNTANVDVVNGGFFRFLATEDYSTSNYRGCQFEFATSPNGGSAAGGTVRMIVGNTGRLYSGATTGGALVTLQGTAETGSRQPIMEVGAQVAASTTPTVIAVTQATVGDPVATFISTATNDDPTETIRQYRVATTDATQTTLGSITLTASQTTFVEARIVARRTGGTAGTVDDGAAYFCTAAFQGAAQIGSTTTTTIAENQAGWDATIDYSANTARVRVTGAANNNITWHATVRVWNVGT